MTRLPAAFERRCIPHRHLVVRRLREPNMRPVHASGTCLSGGSRSSIATRCAPGVSRNGGLPKGLWYRGGSPAGPLPTLNDSWDLPGRAASFSSSTSCRVRQPSSYEVAWSRLLVLHTGHTVAAIGTRAGGVHGRAGRRRGARWPVRVQTDAPTGLAPLCACSNARSRPARCSSPWRSPDSNPCSLPRTPTATGARCSA